MELLKFNDSQKSPRRAKNPAGFIGAGIMVAVMGLSSTLAGTITLNTANSVEFGQGVIATAPCDTTMTITPTSKYDPTYNSNAGRFIVETVTVTNIDLAACKSLSLEFRAYEAATLLQWRDAGSVSSDKAMVVYIPTLPTGTSTTDWTKKYYDVTDGVIGSAIAETGDHTNPTLTIDVGTGGNGTVTLGNLQLSPNVTKVTLETRSARTGESA